MLNRPSLIALVALVSAAIGLGGSVAPPSSASAVEARTLAAAAPPFERVSGATRYATAIAISRAAYPTAGSADVVVIASGENFPDGLAAGPIAAELGGPLLLTLPTSLPTEVREEIIRLGPERIIIAGGGSVVSAGVESALRAIQPDTVRVGGADRYVVAQELIRLAFPGGVDRVYLATGTNYPDALSIGPLAARDGAPLLLVRGHLTAAPSAVTALLDELGATNVTIVGGTGAVSAGFESSLRTPGRTVDRITGADRFAVSLAIAGRFGPADGALVTTGLNYPDGLAAISLAHAKGDPLILTLPYCASAPFAAYVTANADGLTAIGGRGAVTNLAMQLEPCLSTTSASSLWVVANKKNALRPVGYIPSGLRAPNIKRFNNAMLRSDAATALEQMVAAARSAGVGDIGITSGYRSYSTQAALYAEYVRTRGQAWADSQSARAGFSEHQTGLAADLVACSASGCGSIYGIASTAQGQWLFANAHRFGFVLRYPNGKTSITGYAYEPWHWRYVGTTLAAEYHASGHKTLEGYFGYPPAPTY